MEKHITVLKREAVEALCLTPESTVVDATLGSGGHTREILTILKEHGTLIALDADASALRALDDVPYNAHVHLVHRNFRELESTLDELRIPRVDAILADLGWRLEQFTESGKGFSFNTDEPLLMTFGDPKDYAFTARDIVNDWSEASIANVLKGYGEERFARRIARSIGEERLKGPIETAGQLAAIVATATPKAWGFQRIHPATRTFQALRIAVNDELGVLEAFMPAAAGRLAPKGRLAIITFHSIEDRIVKHAMRTLAETGSYRVLTKKPIIPSDEEVAENPRARSAKLRILESIS